jgi:hypothetical protein
MPPDKLMLRFEALGDNCEFGLVQRKAGSEPLGLLRFAGFFIPVEHRLNRLVSALRASFEGLGCPDTVQVEAAGEPGRREYLIKESAYGLMYHSFQMEGRIEPEKLRGLEAKKLEFLRRKFVADLRQAEKILVWKSNVRIPESDVRELLAALREFGPNRLLWVQQEDTKNPAGHVEWAAEGLLKGYVDRLAPYDNAPNISFESWLQVCDAAVRLVERVSGAEPQMQ